MLFLGFQYNFNFTRASSSSHPLERRRGTAATTAIRNIHSSLGENIASIDIINRWFARFAKEDTSKGKTRSGRP